MTLKKLSFLFSLILTFALGGSALAQTVEEDLDPVYAPNLVQPGSVAPDFSLPDMDGIMHSLAEFKGKIVVLNFWASWCPDCRREIPDVKALYKKYGSKAVFVGISFDKSKDKWQKCVETSEMGWLQVSELRAWKDTQVSADYGVKWLPSVVVVGADGKVLLSTVMLSKVESLLKEKLKR